MCGILGIFGFNDKETVKRAGARIVHRGPDMSGHYVDENIELFHRRLSILDLSKKGRQPMTNEDGSVVIVFNGEIYNFKELREKLKGKYEFRTETDTEVIVHLFEENGIACVEQLEGDFAFVIWDSRKKELFIVRDRVGVKPIYYSKSGSKLVFASEYKSIIPFLDKTEVNKQALSDYLSWGFNPGDETMIKGIYSLPPAHWIRVSKTAIKFQKYWDVYKSKEKIEYILPLMNRSVKQRLISDVPLGVYLSGGLDSSAVVATLSNSVDKLKTFSVGFDSSDVIDETVYAEKVSEMYNTKHKNFTVRENSLKFWPKMIWHLDEPINNPTVIPLYVMSEYAKKDVTVVLSGNGGDECFAGYRQHQLIYNSYKYSRFFPKFSLGVASEIFKSVARDQRIANFADQFIRDLKEPEKSYSDLLFKDMSETEKKETLNYGVRDPGRFVRLSRNKLLNDLKYIDLRYRAPNNYLLVDDKVNMSNSVESRVPLFDHRLLEAAWKLPASQQVNLFDKKVYLKKLMKDKLPREIIERKKYGFTSPIRQWFNKKIVNFKDIVYESDSFSKNALDKLFDGYEKDNKKINNLFCMTWFSIWKEMFIEGNGEFQRIKKFEKYI